MAVGIVLSYDYLLTFSDEVRFHRGVAVALLTNARASSRCGIYGVGKEKDGVRRHFLTGIEKRKY